MIRIGITGPTGAGKTTALRALETLGGEIIDCDTVYHALLAGDNALCLALVDRFGAGILAPSGQVDRKKLGGVVFDHSAALRDLNRITHGAVLAEIARRVQDAQQKGLPAVGIDAIALIESGAAKNCDAVVGVLAPKALRIQRIMRREGISESYAQARVEAQRDDSFFRCHCTHILENGVEDTPETFSAKAQDLFTRLIHGPSALLF